MCKRLLTLQRIFSLQEFSELNKRKQINSQLNSSRGNKLFYRKRVNLEVHNYNCWVLPSNPVKFFLFSTQILNSLINETKEFR